MADQSVPDTTTEVVRLDLSAGAVHTVMHDGRPHIVFRPAVTDLGLSYPAQHRKLKTRSWATVAQKATVAEDGKVREADIVPIQTFVMWLATLNENKVRSEARPVLIAFQRESAEALEAYWTKTTAAPVTMTWDHAAAYARSHYGLRFDLPTWRRLLHDANILRQDLAPRKNQEHLFWPTTTTWKVMSDSVQYLAALAEVTARRQRLQAANLQLSLAVDAALLNELPGGDR